MAKKSSMGAAGGILLLLGSLLYLYVGFTWYGGGASYGTALTTAAFFGPFVVALALISAISLFFMSLGVLGGSMANGKDMDKYLWKFMTLAGLTFFIVTAGGSFFYWAVLAFILTYIGGIAKTM
jgi:hypothetical protein